MSIASRVAVQCRRSMMTRSMASQAANKVQHDAANKEFYVKAGNDKAVLTYEVIKPGTLDLQHTEVPSAFRGQGVAAILAKEAFDYVANNNYKTMVSCTYLAKYLEKGENEKYRKHVISQL